MVGFFFVKDEQAIYRRPLWAALPDFSFLEEESSSDAETSVLEKLDDDVLRNEPIPDSV